MGGRAAWLRAAVLGANDGLISTASLMVGVAAADNSRSAILVAGIAGLTAGGLSMAAGEYVSVSSQLDTERADLAREEAELAGAPGAELDELTDIYERRGLTPELAEAGRHRTFAARSPHDPCSRRTGVDVSALARPVQASTVSAMSFISGALLPVVLVALVPASVRIVITIVATLLGLVLLGVCQGRAWRRPGKAQRSASSSAACSLSQSHSGSADVTGEPSDSGDLREGSAPSSWHDRCDR